MLKKLRQRFVKITLLSMILVVMVQFCAINIISIAQRDAECKSILSTIVKYGGFEGAEGFDRQDYIISFFNPFRNDLISSQTPYATKYFVMKISGNEVISYDVKNIPSLKENEALSYATYALNAGTGYGYADTYRYYHHIDSNGISTIAFVDYEQDIIDTVRLAGVTSLVGLFLVLLSIIPIMYLSRKAVKPVERSIEKQKQFITDASHELKTPIAIISANTEVLEMCEGENEWTKSILHQADRLNILVKNLVTLSKLEETRNTPTISEFNLSDAVIDVATPFIIPAKNKNVEMIFDVQEKVMISASESEIRQLISILCDNAVKYVTEGGIIKITCNKRGRTIHLDFYNDCENIEPEKLSKLFDRFYRTDKSRNSKTGGHGIGLSIAQVVVGRNHGTISAVSTKPDSVTFKITF